ncbi:MAG TPA: EamA family transporter [Pseudonocardia sp.]|uniref:EamA family transporter n=1 Tax=Pseudonocardia sp. TaxID=60912 RepID=UPI002EDB2A2B
MGKPSILGVLLCVWLPRWPTRAEWSHRSQHCATRRPCAIGGIGCLPFAGQLITEVRQAPLSANLDILYLGIFPTALAFTTWAYVLSRSTATRLGTTTYIVTA